LAPLEFVLWLPILLFVAAMMVNLGTMAVWRMRGEIVARDAAWRVRWPRTGEEEPRPAERVWPADAKMEVIYDEPEIDALDDPEIDHIVARGPLPNGFIVRQKLAPDVGMMRGSAQIERELPMLPKLGPFETDEIKHPLLDRRWSGPEMGIPGRNYRRTKVLYELPKTDPSIPLAVGRAFEDMFDMVYFDGLRVLDDDEEIERYRGSPVDFHPAINPGVCELDRDTVYEEQVIRLVDTLDEVEDKVHLHRISYLPRTMTNFFLNMYRAEIQRLERAIADMQREQTALPQQIAAIPQQRSDLQSGIRDLQNQLRDQSRDPVQQQLIQSQIDQLQGQINALPQQEQAMRDRLAALPGLISAAEAEIEVLRQRIEPLEQFQARLRGIESGLRRAYREYLAEMQAGTP